MLSYQETESCQEKQSCKCFHFFLFGGNFSEILEGELVYVWNNFHYMTRNTETTLKCTGKILLAIQCNVLVLSIGLILRNVYQNFAKIENKFFNFKRGVIPDDIKASVLLWSASDRNEK